MEVPATEIPSSQLITEDINNIIPYLDKYGVCVVPLKNISTGTVNGKDFHEGDLIEYKKYKPGMIFLKSMIFLITKLSDS